MLEIDAIRTPFVLEGNQVSFIIPFEREAWGVRMHWLKERSIGVVEYSEGDFECFTSFETTKAAFWSAVEYYAGSLG